MRFTDLGSNEAADLSRWQHSLCHQYNRTLDEFPLDGLIDNPKMISLRHLYTRTQISYTIGWPPVDTHTEIDDYSSIFTKVNL